jgi:hypothetical protein
MSQIRGLLLGLGPDVLVDTNYGTANSVTYGKTLETYINNFVIALVIMTVVYLRNLVTRFKAKRGFKIDDAALDAIVEGFSFWYGTGRAMLGGHMWGIQTVVPEGVRHRPGLKTEAGLRRFWKALAIFIAISVLNGLAIFLAAGSDYDLEHTAVAVLALKRVKNEQNITEEGLVRNSFSAPVGLTDKRDLLRVRIPPTVSVGREDLRRIGVESTATEGNFMECL